MKHITFIVLLCIVSLGCNTKNHISTYIPRLQKTCTEALKFDSINHMAIAGTNVPIWGSNFYCLYDSLTVIGTLHYDCEKRDSIFTCTLKKPSYWNQEDNLLIFQIPKWAVSTNTKQGPTTMSVQLVCGKDTLNLTGPSDPLVFRIVYASNTSRNKDYVTTGDTISFRLYDIYKSIVGAIHVNNIACSLKTSYNAGINSYDCLIAIPDTLSEGKLTINMYSNCGLPIEENHVASGDYMPGFTYTSKPFWYIAEQPVLKRPNPGEPFKYFLRIRCNKAEQRTFQFKLTKKDTGELIILPEGHFNTEFNYQEYYFWLPISTSGIYTVSIETNDKTTYECPVSPQIEF